MDVNPQSVGLKVLSIRIGVHMPKLCLCRHFCHRRCPKGDDCRFAHSLDEVLWAYPGYGRIWSKTHQSILGGHEDDAVIFDWWVGQKLDSYKVDTLRRYAELSDEANRSTPEWARALPEWARAAMTFYDLRTEEDPTFLQNYLAWAYMKLTMHRRSVRYASRTRTMLFDMLEDKVKSMLGYWIWTEFDDINESLPTIGTGLNASDPRCLLCRDNPLQACRTSGTIFHFYATDADDETVLVQVPICPTCIVITRAVTGANGETVYVQDDSRLETRGVLVNAIQAKLMRRWSGHTFVCHDVIRSQSFYSPMRNSMLSTAS